jgi:hypothetical protein
LWGASSQALQNGGGSFFQYNNDRIFIGQNSYIDSSFNDKFIGNGYATRYRQYAGTHAFYVSTVSNSSGAGASQSLTQAMTLDASGNLLVGTTTNAFASAGRGLIELNGSSDAIVALKRGDSTATASYIWHNATYLGFIQAENAPMTFSTNNTERARIPAAGGFQVKTCVSVGDATPAASGAGVTFPATQSASSNANTLDDYEEGTWTPTIIGTSSAGTASYPGERNGKYTKIGNVVYVYGNVSWTSGTGTGNLRISGLPFTSANEANIFPAICIAFSNNVAGTANNVQTASVPPNTSEIQFEQYPVGGGAATSIAYDAAGQYSFGGFYYV